MSSASRSGLATARIDLARDHNAPARAWLRGAGLTALATSLCGAIWIALGASDGRYLLDLPTSANPKWIDGPLRGLNGIVGSLGPGGLTAALLLLSMGYLGALLCAQAIPIRTVILAIVLANVAFMLGPTIVSTDVFGYLAYSREIAHHGLNPYASAPIALGRDQILRYVYWKHQPSPYGPLFTALSAPLGFLSPPAALWILKTAAAAMSIATACIVARLAPLRNLHPGRAAIFVGLNPVLLFYAVSGAHNDLLAALLLVCAVGFMLRDRDGAAGATVVAAGAVKLTVGLALPFIVVGATNRGRAARYAALAILAIGVPSLVVFGPGMISQLHRISTNPLFDITFSGPDRLAAALGTHITGPIRAICTGAAAALALALLIRVWRGGDAISALGWAFLGLVASIASLAPWYLVWPLPLAALARGRGLRIATLLATAYMIGTHLPGLGGVPWLTHSGPTTHLDVALKAPRATAQRTGARGPSKLPTIEDAARGTLARPAADGPVRSRSLAATS